MKVYHTDGGVPILVHRKPGSFITYMGAFGAGGSLLEEPRFAGITSIAMRCTIKGTTTRDANQIAEEAEMLGGSISPSAGGESYGWSISVPNARSNDAAALLADVVQRATILEDAFETEQSVALSDVAMLRDDMYRYPMRLAVSAAFPDHPYGVPVSGTEGSLSSLTVDQVREWYRSKLLSAPLVLAIVGDAEPDDMAAMLSEQFGALQRADGFEPAAPVWPTSIRTEIETREKEQTALAIVFPGPSRRDKDRFASQMIATVASGLGGRFFDELRDKQSLAYTVHSFASECQKVGTFASYIATSPEKEDVARDGLLREIAKLREEPVSDEELTQAKRYRIGTHAIRQESGGAIMADMLDAYMFGEGLEELNEFESRVNAVTAESMRELAERYYRKDCRVEGVVRGIIPKS